MNGHGQSEIAEAIKGLVHESREWRKAFEVRQDDLASLRALVRRADRLARHLKVVRDALAALDAKT